MITVKRPGGYAVGLMLCAVLTLTACSGGGTSESTAECVPRGEVPTRTPGELAVILYDLPPFSRIAGGDVRGIDGDLLTDFAQEYCLDISPTAAATAANIPAVQAGRADVSIAAWYRTAGRAEIVGLTEPIYLDQMALISREGVTAVAELEGKTVGTVDGYLWVEDARRILGSALKVYPTTLNLYQDLAAGRIDYGIDSFGSATFNNTEQDYKVEVVEPDDRVAATLEPAQIAIVVNPGNPELLAALNEYIAEAREDGRLAEFLEANDLDPSAGETGPARLL